MILLQDIYTYILKLHYNRSQKNMLFFKKNYCKIVFNCTNIKLIKLCARYDTVHIIMTTSFKPCSKF